ncbi:unnamed protein product [Rhodiola kirilowii]
MGVSNGPTTTIAQHKINQQQHSVSSADTSRSVSVIQNDLSSSSSYAKPTNPSTKKRLTNSRSIIKRRLGQRPATSRDRPPAPPSVSESHHLLTPQSNYHHKDQQGGSSSGINIARSRKKLSKSASFIRPVGVGVRVRTRLKNTKPKLLEVVDNQSQDSSLSKATCSSKFKSTVFPDGFEPQLLEATAPGNHLSSNNHNKICPYTYCSLHGVGPSQGPRLKRFGSVRRRASRTYNYKGIKPKVSLDQLPSQVARDEHIPSNTTRLIPNNNIQMENAMQGYPRSMDQHLLLEDDHSNCFSQISEVPQITKDETHEEYKLNNMSTSHVTDKSRGENEKTTRVWRLIYHSMLSAKYRSELYPGVNTDSQVRGIATPAQANTLEVESTETLTATHTVERSQMEAVKLVEDAIDELFLPEVEEQLSNNQTIISSGASEVDLNNSKLHDITCMVKHCPLDSVKGMEPFSKVGSESISKNWSRLKKVVLLKRFVKALDKLHELKFKEHQILNVEANPEMEKVSLRHQTTDEKRLADEWMLDYALRQAVAKLTPARRKKVELLIEAFETVIPLSKTETPQSHNQSLSTYTVSSGHFSTEKTHPSSVPFKEVDREGITITKDPEHTGLELSLVLTKDALNLGREAGSVLFQCHPPLHIVSSSKHKVTEVTTGLSGHYDDGRMEHIEMKSIASSVCSCDSICDKSDACKMTAIAYDLNHETVQESPLLSASGKQTEFDARLDNQKYFKMWGMIYNHVVSGSAAKIGSELHIIDSVASREAMDSKLEAVKLVEDALDEMNLPEYQDPSSDDQSLTSDQDHLERVDTKSRDSEISTPKDSVSFYFKDMNHMKAKTPVELCRKADVATHTQQPHITDKRVSKTNRLRSNGWSNLKKFILLKRFIRALDKLKKFNPREPENLCLEPDQELEKFSLKRQTTADRLAADQWMIDHAIQQVVARLTPARKRRVELLVEAFETVEAVLPLSNTKMPLKHNSPSAAYTTHF